MYSGLTGWWTSPMPCVRSIAIPSHGWAAWPLPLHTCWRTFWCVRKKAARSPSNSRWFGVLGEAAGTGDGDLLFCVGAAILGGHIEDAVGVDIEGDFDLRH